MISDEALIKGCVKNDKACQQALYARYSRKMMMICQRYTRNTEDAEDILQEGFVKLFTHISSFKGDSKLETWMTRIFINSALNHQRQKLYLFPMVDVYETDISQSEDVSLNDFHVEELLTIVKSLPDGCRVVFNLFAIEGYPHKEIASMLDISEGTSKSQYNRAKMLLRTRLSEYQTNYEKLGKTTL
ncbi:MAG: sigma-70 family RNA polymerase sigma factor [Cyclobacteriaceae bacterium]|nr:sigma-70 family RNA polymerase sigma factor [Cyclobacteriaceae bacterium]